MESLLILLQNNKLVSLKDTFINLYHTHTHHSLCKIFRQELQYRDWFIDRSLPEDFFIIGLGPNFEQTEWLFCVAAQVDTDLDNLKLWFVDKFLEEARDPQTNRVIFKFHQIKEYVEMLIQTSSILLEY